MTYENFCLFYAAVLTKALLFAPVNGRPNADLNTAAMLADQFPEYLERFEANGSQA